LIGFIVNKQKTFGKVSSQTIKKTGGTYSAGCYF